MQKTSIGATLLGAEIQPFTTWRTVRQPGFYWLG
ncbi:hypothetical protein ADIAG_00160 [Paeniglutamicibacter gangotriensis Lz1y]|uniref:Uncharacterized protein n=1 Tax=Paeniglutamicibacter gangotriensis Lz1y TaxID=1276920 RepID=M7MUM9_9MICC|nr:hypothetical protein ADIAG_00160 [Paeniglutamicibacter gangotriensis Lz1y]